MNKIMIMEVMWWKKLKEKKMWSYVDGASVEPTDKKDEVAYAKKVENMKC